ncbi:universal stress protein [Pseudomonas silvicola]|nr:universal stress protein [Pseudomonas silvicola]
MTTNVLIAIDGSDQRHAVIDLAGRYLTPSRHALKVLLAVDPSFSLASENDHIARPDEVEYPAASEQQHAANHLIKAACDALEAAGYHVEGALVQGEPADVIVNRAAALNCGLIVMGHRHLSWLGKVFDPSVSARVLDAARCPVLIQTRSTPDAPAEK